MSRSSRLLRNWPNGITRRPFPADTPAISNLKSCWKKRATRSRNSGFRKCAGELKVVTDKLAGAGNIVIIDTSSLYSDDPRLTGHLKSGDFFGVAQFPTATFLSTALEDKGTNTMVTGDL